MNIFEFLKQVRQELSKVTWPARPETIRFTAMVVVMVAIASIFFFIVDWTVLKSVQYILGLGAS